MLFRSCGTGDLVISLLRRRFDAYGVDFAASMIEKAQSDAKQAKLDPNRFSVKSILDYDSDFKFDLISANGLIEYLSVDEYYDFVKKSHDLLAENGIITIESRNRLFNIFSFNKYTEAEINLGQINHLIEEAILFNSVKSLDELLTKGLKVKLDTNLHQHEFTGNEFINIKVDKRFQYTPFQLIDKLKENGFKILDLRPIHLHGITTGAKMQDPETHTTLSYFLQNKKNIHLNIIPQASSFMIAARKA